MYLDVADSAALPYGWSRYAHFSLSIVNQIDPKLTTRKGSYSTSRLKINDVSSGLWRCSMEINHVNLIWQRKIVHID
jgi:hypothetical protein